MDERYGRHLMERAGDEVRSWFGDDEAERRRRMDEMRGSRHSRTGRRAPVHAYMSRRVASVHPGDPVELAARLMVDYDCGALPVVVGGGRLVGMVTDRDLVVRLLARGRDPMRSRVEDAMTEHVHPVRMDEDVDDALDLMARYRVRRLPVVDDRDRIVGMLSQADLARHAGGGELPSRDVAETISEISSPGRR